MTEPGRVLSCAACGQPGATVDDEGTWFHEDCGFPGRSGIAPTANDNTDTERSGQ